MPPHFSRKKSGPANCGTLVFPLEGFERHQLSNGLTVLTREDHTVPIVSVMCWYRVGARTESPGTTGISHFLEHMMFKGTRRYKKGEIDFITACQGGSNNAFTSHDYTAYYFSFASDRWWTSLEIEADRMAHNQFDQEELELERQVVLEELRTELDSPWGALHQEVDRQAFSAHPYRNPVIGLLEDVRAVTREQMIDHYRLHYAPNNAILVVVGDFPTREAMARITELFGPLPRTSVPPSVTVPERQESGPKRFALRKPSSVSRMLIGISAPSVQQPDFFAFNLLDQILSQGKLSRLHRRLVEKERTVAWVETDFSLTLDPYLFFVSTELHRGELPEKAETQIFEEFETLATLPLSEQELTRAKNQCLAEFYSSCETTLDQATQLGLAETLGLEQHWSDYVDRIRGLTAEEICRVAAAYLVQQNSTVGILSSEPG